MTEITGGILSIFTVTNLALIALGVFGGIIFGAIPGLTVVMGIALCLPLTFGMDPVGAMSLLVAVFIGGVSGGLISAIALNMPGTPASLSTTFDGQPMAKNGEAGKALAFGIIFSFMGTIFSIAVLVFLAPQLSEIAVGFTPFDYFAIIFFSLTLMIGVAGKSIIKGLISGLFGMALASVGPSPVDGIPRLTLGIQSLNGGLTFLSVIIGIYAISQVYRSALEIGGDDQVERILENTGRLRISFSEFTGQIKNFLFSSVIGTFIGILPGLGGGTANIVAYTFAKSKSGYSEKFGTGIPDGIVASESANNAAIGGAMIPLLSMGIPGDPATAMLIGAFLIHGITTGPLLFTNQTRLVYAIFAALVVASVMMVAMQFLFSKVFLKMLSIPKNILFSAIFVMCSIGAFAINYRVFGITLMLVFGIVGVVMKILDYPFAPMIMGFILGPLLEANLRRGLIYSKGSLLPFMTHPIAAIMLTISFVSLGYGFYRYFKPKRSSQAGETV